MMAITVCQPYAHRQALSVADPRFIRIENRDWFRRYDAPLAIHAGKAGEFKDTEYLDNFGRAEFPDMVFGAVVAVAQRAIMMSAEQVPEKFRQAGNWCGPYCIVLSGVTRLPEPVKCRGNQYFWSLPNDVQQAVMAQIIGAKAA